MLIRCRRLIKLVALTTLITRSIKFVYSTGTENNSSNKTGVELDIKSKKTTDQWSYTKGGNNNKVHTYEAKDTYAFNKVKQGNTEIWNTTDSSQYASKVVHDESSSPNTVTIHLPDNKTNGFVKLGDKWNKTPVPVELDIKKTSSSDTFDYLKDNKTKVSTYTPKPGLEFKIVKHDKTEIWKSSGESEHSTKVEVKDLGSNKTDLVIHLKNGKTKKFNKPGKNDPWTHVTPTEESDPNQSADQQSGKQTSSSTAAGKNASSTPGTDGTPTSTPSAPAPGTPANTEGQQPTGTPANPSTDGSESTTPGITLVELDVKSKKTTDQWSYTKDESGKVETYEAKEGYKFSKVKNGNNVVWQPENNEYGTKATLTTDDQGKTKLQVDTGPQPRGPKQPPTHPDKLKIITLESDGTTTKENDSSKYTLKQYDKIYKVEFNDDAKCTKLVCDTNTVYEYKEDVYKGKYPKEIYYNSETNKYYLGIFKTIFIPKYGGDEWKADTGDSKKITGSKFKITTDGSANPNDTSKFDETQEGSFVKCQFKESVKCTELKYNDHEVWKHGQGNHPKSFYFHKLMKVVFVHIEDNALLFLRYDDDKDSWESEKIEKGDFDPKKLVVITPYQLSMAQNDPNLTEKKNLGSIIYYTVKKESDYFAFKYGSNFVAKFSKHDDRSKFQEIYFLLNQKTTLICFDDKCFYLKFSD